MLSTILYSCEAWTTYTHHEHCLNDIHLWTLWSFIWVTWKDRIPKSTVLNESKCLDMCSMLQKHRLRWTGYVVRMSKGWLPKYIVYSKLPDTLRPVHPKIRYTDVLEWGLKSFNIIVSTSGSLLFKLGNLTYSTSAASWKRLQGGGT